VRGMGCAAASARSSLSGPVCTKLIGPVGAELQLGQGSRHHKLTSEKETMIIISAGLLAYRSMNFLLDICGGSPSDRSRPRLSSFSNRIQDVVSQGHARDEQRVT